MSNNKSLYRLMLLMVLVVCLIIIENSKAYANEQSKPELGKRVLILYEERTFFGDRRDSVAVIKDLLGHYQLNADELVLSNWDHRILNVYDSVFVVALDKQFYNPAFIDSLSTYKGNIFWLGASVEPLLLQGKYPLKYKGSQINFQSVLYATNGNSVPNSFPVGSKREFFIVEPTSKQVEIISSFSDGFNTYPFILKSKNLIFVSRVDMNEPLFYIFADVLSRFFYKKNYHMNQAFIAIEDVHVFSDTQKLRKMADEMAMRKQPFIVGLIPFVQQEGTDYVTSFTEVSDVVKTLQYLQSKGGLIVLHIYTHKVDKNDLITAPDLDGTSNPMEQYFEKTLQACMANGLYPIGVEEPHGTMSDQEYNKLKKMFSTFFGQLFINEKSYVIFPYDLYNTDHFNTFIPLNLGYLEGTGEDPFRMIKSRLLNLSSVEGYLGGLYFHSSLKVEDLVKVLDYLESKKISSFNPLERDHWVKVGAYSYTVHNGELSNVKKPLPKPQSLTQQFLGQISNVMIAALSIAFLGFLRAFYKLRQTRRKRMTGE